MFPLFLLLVNTLFFFADSRIELKISQGQDMFIILEHRCFLFICFCTRARVALLLIDSSLRTLHCISGDGCTIFKTCEALVDTDSTHRRLYLS